MECTTFYFEEHRPENTEITFKRALERAKALEIRKIVIASTTGATARKAMEYFHGTGITIIVVPHQYGFREKNPFPPELVTALRHAGHDVHFATMLFHTDNLYESKTPNALATILRCFCQGVKVCFEMVLMAADGGHLMAGEKVIAIAGTGRWADTALVMQAASSRNIKKLRVNELICKPLNPLNLDEVYEAYAREQALEAVSATQHT
jgi:uncharacterized protein